MRHRPWRYEQITPSAFVGMAPGTQGNYICCTVGNFKNSGVYRLRMLRSAVGLKYTGTFRMGDDMITVGREAFCVALAASARVGRGIGQGSNAPVISPCAVAAFAADNGTIHRTNHSKPGAVEKVSYRPTVVEGIMTGFAGVI